MSQEEKDKRTVLGLICAIVILIIIIILVSCNYGKDNSSDTKEKEDPTIIETKDGEDIETIDEYTGFEWDYAIAYPLSFKANESSTSSNTNKKEVLSEEIEKVSALTLVEIAEASLDMKDVETARKVVNELPDGEEKDELNSRLDMVEQTIRVENEILAFEERTNFISTKEIFDRIVEDYNESNIKEMLETLTNEDKKEELNNRVSDLETLLYDTTAPTVNEPITGTYYNYDVIVDVTDENEFTIMLGDKKLNNKDVIQNEGRYTLTVTDKAFNVREVYFVIDKTAPTLTLIGGNANVLVGTTYNEQGVEVTDNIDGKRTVYDHEKIINNNTLEEVESIDTTSEGSYTIYYKTTDMAGNTGVVTRTVNVTNDSLYYAFDNNELAALETNAYNDASLTLNNNSTLRVKNLLTQVQKDNNAVVSLTLQTKLGNYGFNNVGENEFNIDLSAYPGLEEVIFFVDADGYAYDKTIVISITNPTDATFNADKYVGNYTANVGGEELTIRIVKNADGTYSASLPKAVSYKTDTELWTDFNADRISTTDGVNYVYIHATKSVTFVFDEDAGTLTAVTDGRYITNSSETFSNCSTVFTSGVVFSKNYISTNTITTNEESTDNVNIEVNNTEESIVLNEEQTTEITEEKQVQEEPVIENVENVELELIEE